MKNFKHLRSLSLLAVVFALSVVMVTITRADTQPTTVPAAPAITANYSTANMGQSEVVITVTDNANNEAYNQLYWHLSGTAWPSTALNDTYNTSTWSQPANVGRIQIFAPTPGGTYEYQLHACNSAGCSYSNVISINVPGAAAVPDTTPPPSTTPPASNACVLNFTLVDNKTTYTVGDFVNYSYICVPAGTTAASVTIQLVKPDGTATTYNSASGGNLGSVLQQMGFSTSNLANGVHVLRACLNDVTCSTGVYPISFTVVGAVTAPPPTPSLPPSSATNSNTVVPGAASQVPSTTSSGQSNVPAAATASPAASGGGQPTVPTTVPATANSSQNPTAVQTPGITPPSQIQQPSTVTALTGAKCTRYLKTIKSALNKNERDIKNIKQKITGAPENYINADDVADLLLNADNGISNGRNFIKNKDCSEQMLEYIGNVIDDISDTLQELVDYNETDFQYFSAYARCESMLASRMRRIKTLVKKEINADTKLFLQSAISEISEKSRKFDEDAASVYFPEVINQCNSYVNGLDDDVDFYLRAGKL